MTNNDKPELDIEDKMLVLDMNGRPKKDNKTSTLQDERDWRSRWLSKPFASGPLSPKKTIEQQATELFNNYYRQECENQIDDFHIRNHNDYEYKDVYDEEDELDLNFEIDNQINMESDDDNDEDNSISSLKFHHTPRTIQTKRTKKSESLVPTTSFNEYSKEQNEYDYKNSFLSSSISEIDDPKGNSRKRKKNVKGDRKEDRKRKPSKLQKQIGLLTPTSRVSQTRLQKKKSLSLSNSLSNMYNTEINENDSNTENQESSSTTESEFSSQYTQSTQASSIGDLSSRYFSGTSTPTDA